MDQEKNGFPITSLREIRTLMACSGHDNIVSCKEIVVGDTLTQSALLLFPMAGSANPAQDLPRLRIRRARCAHPS